MKNLKLFSIFLLIFAISSSIFAQTSPTESKEEKEKARQELEKKAIALLEQVVNETALLKLPDNRALVAASAGDLMWQRDEKRARQLFRQAANEIVQANNAPATDSSILGFMSVFQNASPRKQILLTVAKHDAELALELLYATRPPNVAVALASSTQQPILPGEKSQKTAATRMEETQNKFLADEELRLEQSFSAQSADKDPTKAAKLLRESIAKNGVTNSVFQSLNKINAKDNKLAVELTAEIGKKLLDSDFAKKDGERNVTITFLQQFYLNSDKPAAKTETTKAIKIEDKLAKDLANKMADYLLQLNTSKGMEVYSQFRQARSVLEKIIPERIALIKQKQNQVKKNMPESFSMFDDDAFDSGGSPSAEKMITGASKMPAQMRGMMYKGAVDEAVRSGNVEKARESLNQTPEGKERDDALAYLDSKIAETKIKDGKIDEASKIIDRLSSN